MFILYKSVLLFCFVLFQNIQIKTFFFFLSFPFDRKKRVYFLSMVKAFESARQDIKIPKGKAI